MSPSAQKACNDQFDHISFRGAPTTAIQPEIPLFDPGTIAYDSKHPSHESQIVRILRKNLVTKMSPQMLILP
jgi:hypothetical protein